MKTNKSFTKRLKLTKTGKIKATKRGFNHFNARQNSAKRLQGNVPQDFAMSAKDRARFLPHN